MCALDLETTAPLPEVARIVSAALAFCGGGKPTDARTWLADPGVEIPEEATAVHGITTERARAEGRPVGEVVEALALAILDAVSLGLPVIVFNARYDFTVLDRECRRHLGRPLLDDVSKLLVVDPSVIDKWLWRYRKSYPDGDETQPSSRTLEGMCVVYRVVLEGAHDASFDAVAAARLAYRMGRNGEVIRRVRGAQEGRELAELNREWEDVRSDQRRLHEAQMRWALAERDRFEKYKRSIGEHDEAARVALERNWPVLDVMAHEEWI